MKNALRSITLWLTCSFILIFSLTLNAQHVQLSSGETDFHLLEQNGNHIIFESNLNGFDALTIKTVEGHFAEISVPGYGKMNEVGKPALPVLKNLIELPGDAVAEIRIIEVTAESVKLKDHKIEMQLLPAQPPVSKQVNDPDELPFYVSSEIYSSDAFYGQPPVKVVPLGELRGVHIARMEVSPFEYNPVTGEIQVITSMRCEIVFKDGRTAENSHLFSPWHESLFGQLINHREPSRELITEVPATYIIVSHPMFTEALQPFIAWKTKKGFRVVEAYTDDPAVGSTTYSIQAYLENFYYSPPEGFLPQSFVLFVGDVDQIPSFSGTTDNHVTDLYYCEYTGDVFPECFYGRFSANTPEQLQPQIDKTLEYEQYLMPDPSFLDEVVMVAGADASHQLTWGNGQINYGTEYYFNAAHGIYSHTYLQPEPAGGNYSGQIRQNVSDGVAYANYTAHCSPAGWGNPSFTTSHIPALTNAHKYPLMVGNCCSSLEFQTNSFGEEVLRAPLKGAIGYIGGSNSTYWDEDFWWGVGFENISANPVYNPEHPGAYDRTFHDGAGLTTADWFVTQGQMPSAGNLAVSQSGSSRETYYWEIYHLMGDPSLMIYFSQPPDISVSYQALMPLATEIFTVTTEPYACVAISKNGILHGTAVAGESGVADVILDPITEPGTADIVVTKQNGKPHIGTVEVASPSGPYVLFDAMNIDDSQGNNNGVADHGEQLLLDMSLKNLGSAVANNITATLSTGSDELEILNATHLWPEINPGESVMEQGAFEVIIAGFVPDQQEIILDLEITDGSETWSSQFMIVAYAPELELGTLIYDDLAGGNGNGRPDAGEVIEVFLPVHNTGNSSIANVTASFTSASGWVNMLSGSYTMAEIGAGETAGAIFTIQIDEQTPTGSLINFEAQAGNDFYTAQATYTGNVGLIIEDFESGNFDNFFWEFPGSAGWVIDNSTAFEGQYSARSGAITHDEQSEISIEIEVATAGEISFAIKVSSEGNYDFLRFYLDGNETEHWSGTADWTEYSFQVDAGMHTFSWVYDKDGSVSNGSDCAWLDNIVFPPLNTAPSLQILNLSIDDENSGNGNGIADPGETLQAAISCVNTGISAAPDVSGTLVSNAQYLSFSASSFNFGNLQNGVVAEAAFDIIIDEDAPAGALADLNFLLASANLSTQQSFYIPIEYSLIEDFETGDFSQFSWQFSGNADWQVTNSEAYEGTYSAVSGDIADNQISGLSLTVDSGTDSEVSFWQKVSSESGYDFLIFYIDGTEMNKWSGNTAWSFESYPLQAGTHVLEWIYDKDHSVSNGSDCAWLDLISLPATPTPAEPQASFMATTTSVDVGGSVQYYDVSTGIPDSFSWTFEGGTPAVSEEENPLVTYDQPGTFSVTLEVSNAMGTSVITLDDYIHAGSEAISQVLNIPQGWSGLSTCMVPQNTQPEAMFAGIMDDLVILQDMNGMMYPAMNINTLGSWDYSRGYKIKLEKAAELELQGWNSGSDELTLDPGWNLIPVMTTCPVLVTDVFGAVSGQITVVKDVAATGVYWPSMNINTLQYLLPGRAYFVNALSQIQVSFTECNKYKSATDLQPNMPPEVYNPAPTPVTHVIAVDEQAISELDPAQESYITARGADGQLYGAMIPHEKVLTVFGDDAFSDQKDGAAGSEPLHFYLEDPKKMHSQKLIAEFDAGLIKGNIFVPDALSKITSLKYETSSTDENTAPQICVYPNPATDRLYIEGVSKGDFVRIFNMQGLAVFNKQLTRTHRTNIDINGFPSGSYLILITGTSTHFSEKITIQ